jgi:hypothetical protein
MSVEPTSTLLFHLCDTLKESFKPTTNKRPIFYWFNDCYHSHIYGDSPGADYMYFFIVNPSVTNKKFFTRHGSGDFASMWADYSRYLIARTENDKHGIKKYLEPGIVYSFCEMVPAVVGKFTDGFNLWAKTIDESKEATFSLTENGKFRRFDEIPELDSLLPGITNSVPILHPSTEGISDPSSFWIADTVNEGRFWL